MDSIPTHPRQTFRELKRKTLQGQGEFERAKRPGKVVYYKSKMENLAGQNPFEKERKRIHLSRRTKIEKGRCQWEGGEKSVSIKTYIPRHFLKARRSFLYSHYLSHFLSTPEPLGLIEKRWAWVIPRKSLVIHEFIEDAYELHWQIRQTFGLKKVADPSRGSKRRLLQTLAGLLSPLYQQHIFHGDLSPQNILVRHREGEWEAFLIDLDDIDFVRELALEHLRQNLLQLADLPRWITDRDKLYFYFHWKKGLPPELLEKIKEDERGFLESVQKGLEERIQERIDRDGKDWVNELNWVPSKGDIDPDFPPPTPPSKK